MVVLTWAEFAVFFFNEEERGHLRGVRGSDFSSGKVSSRKSFIALSYLGRKGRFCQSLA